MKRFDWYHETHRLDAAQDYLRITQILTAHEFPWDMSQALGLALYRTYAVPSIGELLLGTREFTERTQRRYDDTALLLDAMLTHGFTPGKGRDALRRMNQMHRCYDISNDDYRYVLSTFVVMPVVWLNEWRYGWRRLTEHEITATTNYYRELGKHMGIRDIPETYRAFRELFDSYEQEHFSYSDGGRKVSDATLDLMASFSPTWQQPLMRRFSMALLDQRLITAFGYRSPSRLWRMAANAALRTRARIVRHMPPREEPMLVENSGKIRSYPDGYDVNQIGTFPKGCPVPHGLTTTEVEATGARVPAPQRPSTQGG
ncbi:oxygenase MpaB family protein [Salinactinospora qingdaonensis]|uniref:Oxygenase MpaB family protein n=1 Tax=Salinactinospora qingdaonensis TaxID=702744 RepID=A0ABP7FHC4_9ACTN